MSCLVENCDGKILAKGMCRKHYLRVWTHGNTHGVRPNGSLSERLWAKVTRGAPDECWPFTGHRSKSGHGKIGSGEHQKLVFAHRAAYEDTKGPIPDGMQVLHNCDNPACCNPDHLRLGSHRDNMRDKAERGRAHVMNGEDNHLSKLTADLVRRLRRGEISVTEVIAQTGATRVAVNAAKRGATWKHVT